MLYINNISKFIPETYYNLDNENTIGELTQSEIQVMNRFYGLKKIPFYEKSLESLIGKSLKYLIEKNRENIKAIIYVHTIPIYYTHLNNILKSFLLKNNFHNINYFSLNQEKCVSYLRALEVSNQILENDYESSIVILSADKCFFKEHKIMPGISIVGDASVSVLVSKKGFQNKLINYNIDCYGLFSEGTWMNNSKESFFQDTFIENMINCINKTIKGIELNQLKLIIPHNANILCWKKFSKKSKFPFEKIFTKNIELTSHCFNSDNFINLHDAISENKLNHGDYYLIVSIGVGAYFGSALFQY